MRAGCARPVPGVYPVLREAGNGLRHLLGPECDDDGVGVERLAVDLHAACDGVDLLDCALMDVDPLGPEVDQPANTRLEGPGADDGPCLPEAHREVGATVDEEDLVPRVEERSQPGRGRDATEARPEDDDSRHCAASHDARLCRDAMADRAPSAQHPRTEGPRQAPAGRHGRHRVRCWVAAGDDPRDRWEANGDDHRRGSDGGAPRRGGEAPERCRVACVQPVGA